MKENELDTMTEQMDAEALKELNKLLKDGREYITSNNSNSKDQIVHSRFGQEKVDIKETIFRNISFNSLNNWLRKISTNKDVSEFKREIMKISKRKEALYDTYLKSIEPLDEEIGEYNQKIEEIKKNPTMNQNAIRVSKILSQAISQNSEIAAMNAKNILINDGADITIDINKIDELTDQEKDELYEQYLYEFKVLAGLACPEA